MDHLIHVLCLETHNEGISLISFLCSKPLALPVQEHALPLLCSAVKPHDGHFSTEEKTVILNVCKFNSSFKGIFWEKERRICRFRGFCNKQWENKTLLSFEDKEHYTTLHKCSGLYYLSCNNTESLGSFSCKSAQGLWI